MNDRDSDMNSAREKLLTANDMAALSTFSILPLKEREKEILNEVSLRVHSNDGMYAAPVGRRYLAEEHYLSVGLSALRCIDDALDKSKRTDPVRTVLDFPSGYGRVLRFLRVRFAAAEITVSEIDTIALDFCKSEFSVNAIISHDDLSRLSISGNFDLIWCGSLITHKTEKDATDLLEFFHDVLSPDGLCVFTTHGQASVKWIQEKSRTYGLTASSQQEVLSQFYQGGYGYADYPNQHGNGISVVSRDRMVAIARSVGPWDETIFLEQGWDDHHDVYGFTKARQGFVPKLLRFVFEKAGIASIGRAV